MTNTFDNKVYDFIKADEQTERLSFDDVYPVGSIIRLTSQTPPSQGTWVFTGVYGTKSYDETVQGVNISHELEFNGYNVTDFVIIHQSTTSAITWNYTNVLGSYKLKYPYGFFKSSQDADKGFNCGVVSNDNTLLNVSGLFVNDPIGITRDGDSSNSAIFLTIKMELTGSWESHPSSMSNGLSFEYKRTD